MCDYDKNLNNAYQLTIDKNCINKELFEMLDKYCKAYSLEFESLFTSFLTVCSSLCGQSNIVITQEFSQPFSLFSILALNPSRRSPLPLIKDSLQTALNYFNECNNSQTENIHINDLNRSTSKDTLMNQLAKHQCLIQFRNDLPNEMQIKSTDYFPKILLELELYDGLNKLEHNNNLTILKPRLSLLIEESSTNLINLLNKEKTNSIQTESILYQSLITCPKSNRLNLNQLIPFENHINMVHIFFAIKTLHRNNNDSYQFSKESFTKLSSVIDTYNRIVEANEMNDQFISKIYGKSICQFIRLIAVLHAIENSIDVLKSVLSLKKINFNTLYDIIRENEHRLNKTIPRSQINKCVQINSYYLRNKICLSGFNFNDIDIYPELNLDREETINSEEKTFNEAKLIKSTTYTLNLTKSNLNLDLNLTPRLPSINQTNDKHSIKSANSNLLLDHSTKSVTNDFDLIKNLNDSLKLTDKRSKSYIIQTKANRMSKKTLTCLEPNYITNKNDKNH